MYNLVSVSKMIKNVFRITIDGADDGGGAGRSKILHKVLGVTNLLAVETHERLYEAWTDTSFYNHEYLRYDTIARFWHRRLGYCETKKIVCNS